MEEMRVEIVIPKEYLSGYPEIDKKICQFNSSTEYSVNKGDIIMLNIPNKGLCSAVVLSTNDLISSKRKLDGARFIYRTIKVAIIDTSIEG